MRTLKHLAICLTAAFIATGCNQENNEPQTTVKKGTPAEFTMTINGGSNTRTVTTNDDEKRTISWRTGDEVGIFAVGTDGTQSNCKYTYDGTEWKATGIGDAITLENGETYSFYAYYPYAKDITTVASANLNVLPDQSVTQEGENSNYDLSDVLLSKIEMQSYNGEKILLDYTHAYAMVEVLIAGDQVGVDGPTKVILKNVVTDATINLTNQTITKASATQDVIMARIDEQGSSNNTFLYRAIVPEQTISKGNTLLEVYGVNGGKNYAFKTPDNTDITYTQGKYFRMEVAIGTVEAGIKFPGGSITPWEPSDAIEIPGEEIKVQLIKEFTGNDLTVAAKVDNLTEEGWYAFQNKADNGGVISVEELSEPTINWNKSLKLIFTSTYSPKVTNSYYISAINYTHMGPIDIESTNGIYKITYKAKGTVEASAETAPKCNIACVSGDERAFGVSTSVATITGDTPKSTMAGQNLTANWPEQEYTVYVNFSKVNWDSKSQKTTYSSSTELNTDSEAKDLSKVHLRFYTTTNATNENPQTISTLEITDVTMEPYSVE